MLKALALSREARFLAKQSLRRLSVNQMHFFRQKIKWGGEKLERSGPC